MKFDSIEEALEALRNGDSIIVVDDEDRENEGDLNGQRSAWINLCSYKFTDC